MRIALLVVAVGFLLACAQSNDLEEESDLGMSETIGAPIPYFGPPSLEERIASHHLVVTGTLDSTTSEVVAASGQWAGQYVIAIKFHLSVNEYLKGSGASQVAAVWGSPTLYPTEDAAEAARPDFVQGRPTTWDDLEAVFFLHDEPFSLFSALEAPNVYFLGYGSRFEHDDGFYFTSEGSRVWLPAADQGGASGASGSSGDSRRFRLGPPPIPPPDSGGATGATEVEEPTVTIARLKELIALVDADVARGDGSEGYEFCVETKYSILSEDAYIRLAGKDPLYDPEILTTASGNATSTVLLLQLGYLYKGPPERKSRFTLDGPDADKFVITETTPEILSAEPPRVDQFEYQIRATRPLTVGTYNVHAHYSHHIAAECTEHPLLSYEVEYTAVNGKAIHEAYFDPAEWTDRRTGDRVVGASGSWGLISPKRFVYDGDKTATLHRIRWSRGFLYVHIEPHEPFLRRYFGIVYEDGTKNKWQASNIYVNQDVLGYKVADKPFNAGDKLIAGFYFR